MKGTPRHIFQKVVKSNQISFTIAKNSNIKKGYSSNYSNLQARMTFFFKISKPAGNRWETPCWGNSSWGALQCVFRNAIFIGKFGSHKNTLTKKFNQGISLEKKSYAVKPLFLRIPRIHQDQFSFYTSYIYYICVHLFFRCCAVFHTTLYWVGPNAARRNWQWRCEFIRIFSVNRSKNQLSSALEGIDMNSLPLLVY